MTTETISITTTADKAFLISSCVSKDAISIKSSDALDVTVLPNFVVSYKGPISPPQQSSVNYELDVVSDLLMVVGALQPVQSPTSLWIGI